MPTPSRAADPVHERPDPNGEARPFPIGDVLGRSLGVWLRNFVRFTAVGVTVALPALVWPAAAQPGTRLVGDLSRVGEVWLLQAVLSSTVAAVLIPSAFEQLRGRRLPFVRLFGIGIARLLPAVAVALLQTLILAVCFAPAVAAASLGQPLLAVPLGLVALVAGAIVMLGLFVSVAACVVERIGPVTALRRSWVLTRGHRAAILLVFFFVLVLSVMGSLPLIAFGVLLGVPGAIEHGATLGQLGLFGALHAVTVTVVYHDLRALREGRDPEGLAAIFD